MMKKLKKEFRDFCRLEKASRNLKEKSPIHHVNKNSDVGKIMTHVINDSMIQSFLNRSELLEAPWGFWAAVGARGRVCGAVLSLCGYCTRSGSPVRFGAAGGSDPFAASAAFSAAGVPAPESTRRVWSAWHAPSPSASSFYSAPAGKCKGDNYSG